LVRLCDRGLKGKKRAAVFAAAGDLLIKVDKLRVVHPTNGRHRVGWMATPWKTAKRFPPFGTHALLCLSPCLHKPSRQRGPQFPDAGRDAKALAALASQHLGQPVPLQSFAEVGELPSL
jgi:hypothetical protein